MAALSLFLDVPLTTEVNWLLDAYQQDPSPHKVYLDHRDCQTETGKAWDYPPVSQTLLQISTDPTLDHEDLLELGFSAFTRAATELALGRESRALVENRAGSVHTIGGTGAVRIGAEFLQRWYNRSSSGPVAVYVALPQWDSLRCIFQDVGFTELRSYHYWDTARLAVAAEEFLQVLESAPEGSIVMLHAPEETGLTPKQWEDVARVMGKRLFPFFDVPAQGLASGDLDRDAWALRHFVAQGFELLCAQSFSKTFGLYDERVGNLIVVARDSGSLVRICSQLQEQVRATWASPTSLGARVIATVLSNPALRNKWPWELPLWGSGRATWFGKVLGAWEGAAPPPQPGSGLCRKQSLRALVEKILLIREKLKAKLRLLGTPGCWEHLTAQVGTRSFTGLLRSSGVSQPHPGSGLTWLMSPASVPGGVPRAQPHLSPPGRPVQPLQHQCAQPGLRGPEHPRSRLWLSVARAGWRRSRRGVSCAAAAGCGAALGTVTVPRTPRSGSPPALRCRAASVKSIVGLSAPRPVPAFLPRCPWR
ncbi:putative aspartate aminotransferase, cytoplasmic 2 isoform X2 [Pelodiscus sinensis]|uniref:putative aspartate aminotransferase, cytoplasmic 2 isoform X2 n=1 Tax=Pelodiscus sinensis TaxID=13735 RepID=UPI003F6A645F